MPKEGEIEDEDGSLAKLEESAAEGPDQKAALMQHVHVRTFFWLCLHYRVLLSPMEHSGANFLTHASAVTCFKLVQVAYQISQLVMSISQSFMLMRKIFVSVSPFRDDWSKAFGMIMLMHSNGVEPSSLAKKLCLRRL